MRNVRRSVPRLPDNKRKKNDMIRPAWPGLLAWVPLRRGRLHSIRRHLLDAALVLVSLALLTGCTGTTAKSPSVYILRQRLPVLIAPRVELLPGYRAIPPSSFFEVSSLTPYANTRSGPSAQQRIMFALGQEVYYQIYDSGLDGRARRRILLTQPCIGQFALILQQTGILCRTEQGITLMPLPTPPPSSLSQQTSQSTPPQRYVFRQNWGLDGGGVAWDPLHHQIATLTNVQGSRQLAIYLLSSLTAQAQLLATYDLGAGVAHVGSQAYPVNAAMWSPDGRSLLITVAALPTTEEVVTLTLPPLGSPAPAPLQSFPLDHAHFGPTSRFGASVGWFPSPAIAPFMVFAYAAPDGRSILSYNSVTGQSTTVFALPATQVADGRLCAVAWVPTGNSMLFGLCGRYVGFQEDVYVYTLAAS